MAKMTQTRCLSMAGLAILGFTGVALAGIAGAETKTVTQQTSVDGPMGPQGQPAPAPPQVATRDAALAAIDRLGGRVTLVQRTNVTRLDLESTKVTDADLKLFQDLTDIESLNLCRTAVTDAGLESLRGMTKLTTLELYETGITDAGLEHLKGLTKLYFLMLKRTDVTDVGAAKLQRALPNCLISHSPRNPPPAAQIVDLTGRWTVEFANGVKQQCEIRSIGTAHVAEPLRTSDGLVGVQSGKVILAFDDDRVERWTVVGKRVIVEHWVRSSGEARWEGFAPFRPLPAGVPVLGIAERVQESK